jgi:hypothetical protein
MTAAVFLEDNTTLLFGGIENGLGNAEPYVTADPG